MGALNQAQIAAAQIAFNTKFNDQFAAMRKADPAGMALAMETPSLGKIEQYNWLGAAPLFTEWTADRPIAKPRNNNYQIVNKKWANGLEVDEDDFEDDTLGQYGALIGSLADSAFYHRISLSMDFLVNGFATTKYGAGYDGVAFFGATHKQGSGSGAAQNNKITKKLTTAGALDDAYNAMLSIQDENGTPMYIYPSHIICGPKYFGTAKALLGQFLASGATNPYYNIAELIISPTLVGANADKWFLACLTKPLKPLIFQMRRPVTFRYVGQGSGGAVDGETDSLTFNTGKHLFGADARYNVGYGLWEFIVGSDGST